MNETEALRHVLDTLCKKYDSVDSATSILDHNDTKFAQLMNAQNRIARSILATVSLMRDPKREILLDRASEAKQDVARLAKEILEAEKSREDKKRLAKYKDEKGKVLAGSQAKKITSGEKTALSSKKAARISRRSLKK